MEKLVDVYEIRVPVAGQPDGFAKLCRAQTAEMAAEVVRILLDTRDQSISEIRVVRGKMFIEEL